MIGNRPSALPVAQFCSLSAKLGREHDGASRHAFVSSVFHAMCANAPRWREMADRLTPEEHEEMAEWREPGEIIFTDGTVLRYADAEKEITVGLAEDGSHLEPGFADAMTEGTPDLYWIVESGDQKVAYIGDLKRSEFTMEDGPLNLQNLAYAFAVAAKHGATHFACGLWGLVEGQWVWSHLVDLGSREAVGYLRQVRAAAMHTDGSATMGSHCSRCYQQMRCPEYLLPPEVGESLLAPLVGNEVTLTPASALSLKLACDRVEKTAEFAKEILKRWADDNGGIVDEPRGKVWKSGPVAGRKSLDKTALEADNPGLLDRYTVDGKPSKRFAWKNL